MELGVGCGRQLAAFCQSVLLSRMSSPTASALSHHLLDKVGTMMLASLLGCWRQLDVSSRQSLRRGNCDAAESIVLAWTMFKGMK